MARLSGESSRELTRTEIRDFRQVLDGEPLVEILPRERRARLDAIRFGSNSSNAENCDCPGATVMKDKFPGYGARHLNPDISLHQSQH